MIKPWRLLLSPPSTGAWNMAIDEALLESIVLGDSPPTFRLYAWNPPCLSLGRSQPIADVDIESLKKKGWDLVRRATGGRAILHTDELTYSIIAAQDNIHFSGSVLESYRHLAIFLLVALKDLGINVEMNPIRRLPKTSRLRKSPSPSNPVCFETPSTYEITVNGKKLIGSAQARQKGGVLQHGSLPLTGNLARITDILNFPNIASRQMAAKKLMERASTAESASGKEITWEAASKSFTSAFESVLGIKLMSEDLSQAERSRASQLIQKKYAHPDWTERI